MDRKWALLRQILTFRKAALELSAALDSYWKNPNNPEIDALEEAHDRFKKVI